MQKNVGIRFSMRQRQIEKDEDNTPGPGGYDIKSMAIEGKSPSMKKRQKTLLINCNNVPGPGKYEPKISQNGRIFKIANSDHKNFEDVRFYNQTGPGTYNPQLQDIKGPSYTMGLKKNNNKLSTFQETGFTYNISGTFGFMPSYMKSNKNSVYKSTS